MSSDFGCCDYTYAWFNHWVTEVLKDVLLVQLIVARNDKLAVQVRIPVAIVTLPLAQAQLKKVMNPSIFPQLWVK